MKRLVVLLLFIIGCFMLTSCQCFGDDDDDKDNDNDDKPVYTFKSSDDLKNDLDNFKAIFLENDGSTFYMFEDSTYIFVYYHEEDEIKYLYHKKDREFFNITSMGKSRIANGEDALNMISLHINPYFDNYLGLASTFLSKNIIKGDDKGFLGRAVTIYNGYTVKGGAILRYEFYVDVKTQATIYCQTFYGENYDKLLSTWQLTAFEVGGINISKMIS